MYVVDSTILIEALRELPRIKKVQQLIGDEPLTTTTITFHELFVGVRTAQEQFIIEGLFSSMTVLSYDLKSAKEGARIEKHLTQTGRKINKMDTLIAGICKANNATLVTLDKDFTKIDDLNVEYIE